MTKFHTLLTTTALVAFAALPVHALTLDPTAKLGLYTAGMVPMADMEESTGAAGADGAASAPAENSTVDTNAEVFASTDDSTGPAAGDNVASAPTATTNNLEAEVFADTMDSTGAATGDEVASAPGAQTAEQLGTVLIADSGFNADDVIDATGAKIGVVESVIKQSDNDTTLIVLVNGGMVNEGRFTLGINPAAESDGVVQLYWTTAELNTALAAL